MSSLKVLICTFSQTGSTDKVARKIAEGLVSSGMEVGMHSILTDPVPDPARFDVLGIGSPVYAFRPPFPVTDFIKKLPDLKKKFFFTFINYGSNPGAAGNIIRRQLRKKHAIDAGYLLTRSEYYFISYLRRGYLFSPGFPGNFEMQTASEFGVSLAHRITNGYPAAEPYDPPTHFVYALERSTINRFSTKLYLSKSFKVNKKCDGCGVCIKKCPVHNLKEGKNKRPVWGNDCILCATCEYKCPKDAIRSPYDWAMNSPFFGYNIRRAIRKHTPYARVKFENGRMVMV